MWLAANIGLPCDMPRRTMEAAAKATLPMGLRKTVPGLFTLVC